MPSAPAVRARPASAPARLARALDEAARTWDAAAVRRVCVDAPPADALAWLAAQDHAPAVYWHARDGSEAAAAWGQALAVDAPDLDALAVPPLPPEARLYGAARFAPTGSVDEDWAVFGRARFVLPRVEFRVTDGRATLSVCLAPGESAGPARDALARLTEPAASERLDLPAPVARTDAPDRAGWEARIRAALGAIASGELDKVVLARRSTYRFATPVDAFALMHRLQDATPRCFHALVATGDGRAFLSATPERLFRLRGGVVETEAVAGTRPRAAGAADDRLRDELLESDKERREHAFVHDAIAECLAPLSSHVESDPETGAMTLARGRHLHTGLRATLREHASAADVLRVLHPTPAVGGTPRDEAEAAIARLEPFDRGLYAGPVGWIGRDADGAEAAEIAVGIRSGLLAGSTLHLYAGAGIVEGSEAGAEWDEIEHKASDFARVFGLAEAR